MEYNRIKEEIISNSEEILNQITRPAKAKVNGRTSYICPLCGNGSGSTGDGLAINPKSKDGKGLKCFKCGFSGDIIDLIGESESITEYPEKLKRAGEYIGIRAEEKDPVKGNYKPSSKPAQNQPKTEQNNNMNIHTDIYTQEEKSFIADFKRWQSNLSNTDYHTQRGISGEVARRFMLGFNPHFKTKDHITDQFTEWEALIIPTGKENYVIRNTDPRAKDKNRYRNRGESIPFNTKALKTATKPIFIVEGELDALSIIEAGGEAIGLGSTNNVDKLVNVYLKNEELSQPLIIALDNDEAGEEATDKLIDKLDTLKIKYYKLNPAGEYKDANSALLADREAFTAMVKRAENIELEEYRKDSAYNHLQDFIDGIAESANTPAQPTGFTGLDNLLDGGLYEGLYIIGAVTSLGKTTFSLQMADQIAESGREVLIFSLEMARSELMSKSISRLTLLDVLANNGDIRNAKTNRGITAGAKYEEYSPKELEIIKRAINTYREYTKNIIIKEGIGDIGTAQIREIVKEGVKLAKKEGRQSPVVLIDYLQILAPHNIRATDKQNTDKAVLELKRISRDYKIPVIGISSFNRDNYTEPVSLTSFKESGAIEYSSDVLIGLQYKGMDYKEGEKEADRRKRIREVLKTARERAKNGQPQEIQLKILKYRNGSKGEMFLEYYPRFNYFKEEGGEV